MTLRTRRSLALLGSFMFVVTACSPSTPAATPGTTPPASTPTTAAGTPVQTPTGTISGATGSPVTASPTTGGSPSGAPSPSASATGGVAPGGSLIVRQEPDINGPAAAEQVLRIDLGGEPPTLDPTLAQDSISIAVLNGLHRGLVYYDAELKPAPAVAQDWEVSDDGLTYTFNLRPDAKYSNGDPITATDFVYSWKRLVDPRTEAPYAYNMCDVAGAEQILGEAGGCGTAEQPEGDAAIDAALENFGVSAPDPQTFVVKLKRPATYFLAIAGLWHSTPVQQKWVETANFTEAANYVSSGPFQLAEWQHNSRIILRPNQNWYGETKPTLTEIQMSMIDEPAAVQAAYEAGTLDMALTPGADIRRVIADPALGPEVVQSAQFAIGYYNYNYIGCKPRPAEGEDPADCEGPTKNKNFRIALTQAIDKAALIETTFGGTGVIANSIVPPGMLGHQADLNPYPFDLEAAKAAMTTAIEELGFENIGEVPPLRLTYNTGGDHEARIAFLSQAWSSAFTDDSGSLRFEQFGNEFSTFLNDRHNLNFDVARNGWSQDYPHPNNFLNDLFRCGGGNNDSGYCNREYDKLIDQAAAETDVAAQERLYQQAQEMLMNDVPVLPLRWTVATYTVKPWVAGVTITAGDAQLPGDLFYETIKILQH